MRSIYDMPIPSQRWALPQDDKWDIYFDRFYSWADELYDDKNKTFLGHNMTWEEVLESEEMLDAYIEQRTDRSD